MILTSTVLNLTLIADGIPFSTRAYWMRRTNQVLGERSGFPCPFAVFGTAVVNHTDTDGFGDLIRIGVNQNRQTGNPPLHGEIAAITNCTAILADPYGRFRLTASEAQAAFVGLTLYTNAESCPMTVLIGDVLANETDPYYLWQFDPAYPCPDDCSHFGNGTRCRVHTKEELR
ncbi:hypothetical protein BDV38DRAFT_275263 [Aspergillus pseudotamarii]|uniref:Uncharacterized protein n=1 Tax=Aspergillus pseudotamarii TaxID=132259 RepID=A0A5N6SFT2_ASPPS|nr:uncharacterized protein BDV38DRAFT_275263 [Aspergillus pseudotamarii]KAE8132243.1 hypothetical protein BDV38DRAFT_275263 [Aspergillus pseudotamarii]